VNSSRLLEPGWIDADGQEHSWGSFLTLVLSVVLSLVVGTMLIVVPWTDWWDSNYLLQPYPAFQQLFLSGYVRGAVAGLGLVNILIAVYELFTHLVE
jgi:hypothetical protein